MGIMQVTNTSVDATLHISTDGDNSPVTLTPGKSYSFLAAWERTLTVTPQASPPSATDNDVRLSPTVGALKEYVCHKKVRAMQIVSIVTVDDGRLHTLYGDDGHQVHVPDAYFHRHTPNIGGYYVLYADGYESYSPKKPFEEGYSLNEAA